LFAFVLALLGRNDFYNTSRKKENCKFLHGTICPVCAESAVKSQPTGKDGTQLCLKYSDAFSK